VAASRAMSGKRGDGDGNGNGNATAGMSSLATLR
jgi:hypothetical protein